MWPRHPVLDTVWQQGCPAWLLLLVGLLLTIVVLWLNMPSLSARSWRHRHYQAQAARILVRLPQLAGDAQRLRYLRKINPYVFEELLLLAFERQGLTVIRNCRYSGDGGLDGQVFIARQRYLIQAKRYSQFIAARHIQAFGTLLIKEQCGGFFIHTGRIGPTSRTLLKSHPRIQLISGQRLLDLLAGKRDWLCPSHFQRSCD
ncbi:restriction endonuclease [Photorhabdus bodei]|uniref:Restriction endonuclease n=1 Tax=Photorhabdus bodei TaxID=2029681 RepID=A0A329X0G8_9GAMM|nr:restriction endonuclease [Photorhabdus bodei]RAX09440.1 restriction endonuclease [Photorhabdus bodei]